MKDLTKKLGNGKIARRLMPLTLVVAGIIGCATYPTEPVDSIKLNPIQPTILNDSEIFEDSKKNLIDFGNGYFARTDKAAWDIDLIASALLNEVILKKTENRYTKRITGLYAKEEAWNSTFNQSCKFADANKDYILEEDEVRELLDLTYESIQKRNNEIIWVEEE